jgi:hypothetical protein
VAEGLEGFAAELSDVSLELTRIGDLADGVGRSLTRALSGAVLDGKSLKDVLSEVSRAFAEIALKAALKPLGQLAGGLVEGLFTATNPVLGGVTPFGGGGFAAPAFLGRAAQARTAGPVAAAPGAVNVHFNVSATDARSFVGAEAEVSAMLLRAVRRGTRAS